MMLEQSNNLSTSSESIKDDVEKIKKEAKWDNKKMLTMDPKLIKEMQEYADKWAAGSFSSFVAMMFQIFKNNIFHEEYLFKYDKYGNIIEILSNNNEEKKFLPILYNEIEYYSE